MSCLMQEFFLLSINIMLWPSFCILSMDEFGTFIVLGLGPFFIWKNSCHKKRVSFGEALAMYTVGFECLSVAFLISKISSSKRIGYTQRTLQY